MNIDWIATLQLLSPELVLTIGAMVVLVVDMLVKDDRNPVLPGLSYLTLFVSLGFSVYLMLAGGGGPVPYPVAGVPYVSLFVVDNLMGFFRVLVLLTSLMVLLVSGEYVSRRSRHTGEFYALLLFITLSVMLVSGSTDLIMIYLCFEFLSITSYVMVGWLRDQAASNEAAMKYLLYGAISSAIMLYGMSLLYGAAGSTQLTEIARVFADPAVHITPLFGVALPALALMMAGFGFKIALVPFHQWSPDAYEGAPTPVAAFLSVGSKAAGFAILIRVLLIGLPEYTGTWQVILSVIAILSMTLGNLVALMQQNMKRMLAYSSIAQAGYVLMGLVAYGPIFNMSQNSDEITGIGGLMIYLMTYLFTNVGAFIAVIAYEEATGSVTIRDYAGMFQRAPWLAGAMVVFMLSLAGIPPTAGFIGKFFVFGAAVNQGFIFLAVVGVVNSVISVAYYFNVMRQMFFQPPPTDPERVSYPASLGLALGISVFATFFIGLYPAPFLQLAAYGQRLVSAIGLSGLGLW